MVKRLAIVGSGTGGTFAANLLSTTLRDRVRRGELQVLLIGEGFRHYFQPANLEVAFKGASPEAQGRAELDLLKDEVTFIPDPATRVDPDARTVTTTSGSVYSYDYIIMATGAEVAPELIPGLKEGSLNFHTGPRNAAKIWDALKTFRKGKIVVAIASVPHKCPPSPDEAMFMLDEYFRSRGVRKDVELELVTPYPRPYPAAKIADVIEPLFEEKRIGTVPFFNMESVDPQAKRVYSLEGDEVDYDLLLAVPPHRGVRVVRDSGLGDEEGWIPTDKRNLTVKDYDDVFAIGDATNIPISKSGVVAHLESKVAALNIVEELEGRSFEFDYNGRINCPMDLGGHKAIFVSATYKDAPTEQSPSRIKYAMKRGFGAIYWSTLSGRWDWLMDAYFGPTSEEVPVGS